MKRWVSIAIVGLVFGAAATHAAQVGLIKIDGAIGPATASYIARAIDVATAQDDECLIIQLDTPGGLRGFRLADRREILRRKNPHRGLCRARPGTRGQRGSFHHHGGGCGRDGAAHAHWRGASGGTRLQR